MEKSSDHPELVDLRTVSIDKSLPKEERMAQFLQQIKDPYHFRVGNIEVKISYRNSGATLEERLREYFKNF